MKLKLMVLSLFVFLLGVPALVSAQGNTQGRGRGTWNQRDNRNNRNNQDCDDRDDDYRNTNNGRNGSSNTNRLNSSIQSVRDLSRDFQDRLDTALDNSRLDDRREEDRINKVANDFKNKADDLKDRFNNGRDLNRSQNEARDLLRLGEELDNFLSRNRLDRQVQNDWNQIARNLEVIGDAYGYDFYAGNNNNRNRDDDYYGNNRNGNNRNTNTSNTNNRNTNTRNSNGGWRNLPNVVSNGRWPF